MQLLTAISLASLTLVAISLQRTYNRLPPKELKRQARQGDRLAAMLYKAVAYERSLNTVLWLIIGILSASFFVFVAKMYPWWVALVSSLTLIWVGFVWVPAAEAKIIGKKVAGIIAPALGRLLYYLYPALNWLERHVGRFLSRHRHTGIYEKADLLDLIDEQQSQDDNRINHDELKMVRNILVFGDKLISDVMTPRRDVKTVSADDDLGPIIMSELHKSGHTRFPVYEKSKDNIVGTLFLRDLLKEQAGGKVQSVMHKEPLYLHEEQTLHDALQAVLKTHRQLFIVLNSQEEFVGIVTIDDVFEHIIGKPIFDEFDEYDNKRAVASRKPVERLEDNASQEEPVAPNADAEADETIEID